MQPCLGPRLNVQMFRNEMKLMWQSRERNTIPSIANDIFLPAHMRFGDVWD